MKSLHLARMRLKDSLRRQMGVDLVRYPLYRVLRSLRISMVLDIGANRGQFAMELFRAGYRGRVVSFEPIPEAYHELEERSRSREGWSAVNVAIGATNDRRTFRITARETSSSLYKVDSTYAQKYGAVLAPAREVEVDVGTLDRIGSTYIKGNEGAFVKIDVQGAELEVIEGGHNFIRLCRGLQVESSLVPMYESAPAMEDVMASLRQLGFSPVWIAPGYKDPVSWYAYDCDVIYISDQWIW